MATRELEHTRQAGHGEPRARTIRVVAETSVPAARVLEAAYDFSERRAAVFPAVRVPHLEVHELGPTSADVTEGTPVGGGVNWERCRYDWSRPGVVTATVTDSNVYAVGRSLWEITAVPSERGSRVEMVWTRRFRRDPRGRLFGTLFAVLGRPLFGRYARRILANLETGA